MELQVGAPVALMPLGYGSNSGQHPWEGRAGIGGAAGGTLCTRHPRGKCCIPLANQGRCCELQSNESLHMLLVCLHICMQCSMSCLIAVPAVLDSFVIQACQQQRKRLLRHVHYLTSSGMYSFIIIQHASRLSWS